jgi:hypothetical protein
MTSQKLTKKQEEHRQDLRTNGQLYVGHNCPAIMKSFEILVSKGYARIVDASTNGKHFATTEG